MDPFLLTHNVRHLLYDIGPRISPISIRDQMMRGYVISTRAIARDIIGPDKPLLVIGAGAAGATAAMVAADHDIPTTLLERTDQPFSLQSGCPTRWVDPTAYDWPAQHWAEGKFPWRGPDLPLPYEGGLASTIAGVWENKFEDEVEENEFLTVVRQAELDNPQALGKKPSKKRIQVYFKSRDGRVRTGPFPFAMIISCIGAGPDRVEIGNYRGRSFWTIDSYQDDNLGLRTYTSPRVLISGSGDGALQDFLRIVTMKNSAKEVYQALPLRLQAEVAGLINSKEDQYQRAFTWSGNADGERKIDDCFIQATLHEEYREVVDKLLGKYETELPSTVDLILKDGPERLEVTMAFECGHFSHCYPLNHFLALFLARYIEIRASRKVLYPDTRVVKLAGSDITHVCKKDPADCEGQLHEATFIQASCETPRNASISDARPLQNGPFNVIVVRHGIDWNEPLFGDLPNTNRRQMLPYYLGWGR